MRKPRKSTYYSLYFFCINFWVFMAEDQCSYKQCRSRWDGSWWAISSWSTLFASLFLIYNGYCHSFGNNGCVHMHRWNSLIQKLRAEKVMTNIKSNISLMLCVLRRCASDGHQWHIFVILQEYQCFLVKNSTYSKLCLLHVKNESTRTVHASVHTYNFWV